MGKEDTIQLRQRLVFQLGVPFVIFILFILGIFIQGSLFSIRNEEATIAALPRTLSTDANESVIAFFRNLESNLQVISRSVGDGTSFSPEDRVYLENILEENPTILELTFFDGEGNRTERFATPTIPESIELDPSSRTETITYQTRNGDNQLFNPQMSIYNTTIVHWAFLLKDEGGMPVGTMRATIDLSGLWSILTKYRGDTKATVYIVDAQGNLIVANTDVDGERVATIHRNAPEVASEVLNEDPRTEIRYGAEWERVIATKMPITPTDWVLVAEVSLDTFTQKQNRTLLTIGMLFAALLLLLLYELYIVRTSLLIPLGAVTRAAKAFASGDYKTRISVNVDNEFLILANTLNVMGANIDEATSAIVERLKTLLMEQDRSAKLLVRRDLELVKANSKLKRLDEAKSEFVSVAAHQLRTPLSAVKWGVHMLLGGDLGSLTTAQKEVLFKTAQSNDRMIKLINDLLNVDHIESGKSEYVFIPVAINDLIESVLAELRPIGEQRGVSVQYDPGMSRAVMVRGDRDKLRGIIQNLLDNAIKYTLKGGSVRVGISEDDTHIKIAIADTGIGIPSEDQQKVFGKFFRSKNAVNVATEGTGLGLFIIQEIARQHQGKIWFDSAEGVGTTFYVLLPKIPGARAPGIPQ